MIVKSNNKYLVKSSSGKILGEFSTRKEALERLRQIEYFKNQGENNENRSNKN